MEMPEPISPAPRPSWHDLDERHDVARHGLPLLPVSPAEQPIHSCPHKTALDWLEATRSTLSYCDEIDLWRVFCPVHQGVASANGRTALEAMTRARKRIEWEQSDGKGEDWRA